MQLGHRTNSKGTTFGLGRDKNTGKFAVCKLSENYDGKVRGGIRKSWCVVANGLEYDDARALFDRKTAK